MVGQRRGEQKKTTATTSTSDLKVSDDRRKAERRSGRKQKEACASRLQRPSGSQTVPPPPPPNMMRFCYFPTQISAAQDMACDMGSFARVAQASEIADMLHRPILHYWIRSRYHVVSRGYLVSFETRVRMLSAHGSIVSAPMIHHHPCRYCRKSWLFCP